MKILKKSRLRFTEGNSDKVYEVDLCELNNAQSARYVVNFRYGRYGNNLREGTKTPQPETLEKATKIFDSLVVSKTNKGYQDVLQSADVHATPSPRDEVATADNSDNSKQTILAYLDNPPKHWSLSRIIWRAGELQIREAADKIAALGEKATKNSNNKKMVPTDYSIIWALGRCGDNRHYAVVEAFRVQSRQASLRQLATLVAFRLADANQQSVLLDEVLKTQLASLSQAIENDDASVIKGYFVGFLANSNYDTIDTHTEALLALYTLSLVKPCCRQVFEQLLDEGQLNAYHFNAIRKLFKFSEFLQDTVIYAKLTALVQQLRAGWEYRLRQQSLNYLRRRSWRTLRKLGDAQQRQYIDFATAILLQVSDEQAAQPRKIERQQWDWETRSTVTFPPKYLGRFPDLVAFNQILYRHSEQHLMTANGLQCYSQNAFDSDGTLTERQRSEAYPRLWDKFPDDLLHLLCQSRCLEVHQFAVKALRDNGDYTRQLSVASLVTLLASDYAITVEFALPLAQTAFAQQQDSRLIIACLTSTHDTAQQQALTWLADYPDHWQDPAVLATLICQAYQREALQDILTRIATANPLNAEQQQQTLIAVGDVLQALAAQSQRPHAVLSDAGIRYVVAQCQAVASVAVAESDMPTIATWLAHDNEYLALFGALLLLESRVAIAEIPADLLISINQSPSEVVQSVGVSLLSKHSDAELVQKYDVLLSYAVHEKAAMRSAIRPIIQRLADSDAAFSGLAFAERFLHDLIPFVFRAEPVEGLHADLCTLAETALMPALATLDPALRWRLLQAKSKAAQALGALSLSQTEPTVYSLKQWANLAKHETLAVRQWVQQAYATHVEHVKNDAENAIRLLNTPWQDTREFGIDFFRTQFDANDWSAQRIVGICDNTYDDVQRFGRELLTTFFNAGDGEIYLMRLSQHPSRNVQLFVTNYLADYAAGNVEIIKQLRSYFITVLSQVCSGRIAKDRIIAFLNQEALQNEVIAELVADIYAQQSVTLSIMDKADYIEGMHALHRRYPELKLPIVVQALPIKRKQPYKPRKIAEAHHAQLEA